MSVVVTDTALTPFELRLGTSQGRIVPRHGSPESGSYAFVLGDDDATREDAFVDGDYAQVVQSLDLTDVDFIRASLLLRAPEAAPTGLEWRASIVVDGVEAATARCKPGRTRRATDLAANVSKLTGAHTIGVRLALGAESGGGGGWTGVP